MRFLAGVFHMNVIGCHNVVEHAQTEPLPCFKDPVEITATVPRSEIQTSNIER
jgi:hypothetical protein